MTKQNCPDSVVQPTWQTALSLSVAMCTCNGAIYLPAQLASLAAQTRLPDEIVVCDDNSSDGTAELVRNFASAAPFPVRLYINDENLGSTRNFEKAIGLCSGDLIALCDQDDVWLPDKLRLTEQAFQDSPRAGVVFTDAEVVDENLQPTGRLLWDEVGFGADEKELVESGRALDVLLPGWTVTGATMAFRSCYVDLVLPIPRDIPMIHDGWIALMVATVAAVRYVAQPLMLYRQHPLQQIGVPAGRPKAPHLNRFAAIKASANRNYSYDGLIEITDHIVERLLECGDDPTHQQALDSLKQRRRHLNARTRLPASIYQRLPLVLGELFSLRYSRFSNGVASAAKDLIYGARSQPPFPSATGNIQFFDR